MVALVVVGVAAMTMVLIACSESARLCETCVGAAGVVMERGGDVGRVLRILGRGIVSSEQS